MLAARLNTCFNYQTDVRPVYELAGKPEVLSITHMDKKTQNVQEKCGICNFQIFY